jgi:hypothetical protein
MFVIGEWSSTDIRNSSVSVVAMKHVKTSNEFTEERQGFKQIPFVGSDTPGGTKDTVR